MKVSVIAPCFASGTHDTRGSGPNRRPDEVIGPGGKLLAIRRRGGRTEADAMVRAGKPVGEALDSLAASASSGFKRV